MGAILKLFWTGFKEGFREVPPRILYAAAGVGGAIGLAVALFDPS